MTEEEGLDMSALSIREGESDLELEQAEALVCKWENVGEQMVWESSSEEAESFLRAVDTLHRLKDQGVEPHRVGEALRSATTRLKKEFKHLLAVHTESIDPSWLPESFHTPSFSSTADPGEDEQQEDPGEGNEQEVAIETSAREFVIDLIQPAIVADLSEIATRLVLLGHARDCIDTYVLVRKGILEASMFLLGVEKVAGEDIQRMPWESLEPRVKKFIKGMKVAVKVLFASERFLSDEVFAVNLDQSDSCFGEMADEAALQVLSTFKACATGPGSPERLFRLLDMYEALRELLPEIRATFQGQASVHVVEEAEEVVHLLGEAVKCTFMELKNAIENDTSKTGVAGGALHPLTRYVMNYLGFLSEYLDTLKELYGDVEDQDAGTSDPNSTGESEVDNDEGAGQKSGLEAKVLLVLEALMKNVEDTSKHYKDSALSSIFMMNNTHYIVQKSKTSELQSVIGNSWLRRHSSLVRYHAINYQRLAWGKIFSFLRDEGIRGPGYNVSREVLKDRLKNFNACFEEIHKTQSGWVVPEAQLRDEIRVLITDKLLPAYRSFVGRYRQHLEGVRHVERYLKYTPEDMESQLNDLFEGASGSMNRRRSFSTG